MTSKQRAYLRGLANSIDAIFQVGKSGITENQIQQLKDALGARELIKISVLETAPLNARELGEEIANLTNSTLVQTIGNKITLFKQRKKDSKITLPNYN
nr:ribosome assembly RNA-binding protein YhbY [Clostridia bacterium]